jgi:hypothetical protein
MGRASLGKTERLYGVIVSLGRQGTEAEDLSRTSRRNESQKKKARENDEEVLHCYPTM